MRKGTRPELGEENGVNARQRENGLIQIVVCEPRGLERVPNVVTEFPQDARQVTSTKFCTGQH